MDHPTETYTADAELAALLVSARASGKPIRVSADGETYELQVKSLTRRSSPYAGYSAEQIREVLDRTSGIISDDEAERMKRLIYDAREQGTRPPDQP